MDTLQITSETLSGAEQFNEYLMTGLRTKWGVDLNVLRNLHTEISSVWDKKLTRFVDQGLIYIDNDKLLLSRQGKFYADQISSELFV